MVRLAVTLLGLWLLLFGAAWAGGGPTGFLVLYDEEDPASVAVANHYQQARGIPERNMVAVSMPRGLNGAAAWTLIETLRAAIADRGLGPQLQGIAIAGYAPLGASPSQGKGAISLAAILYNAPNYADNAQCPRADSNYAYRQPPETPTTALDATMTFKERRYWPVSHVGPTDRVAFSLRAALQAIDRAKAADGHKPDGVIYWPLNRDVRSTTREHEINQVLPVWTALGMKYSILDGIWVKSRGDIAGGVVGIAVTDTMQDNRYLPGAWVDHLTSYGGVLSDNWQMPCTDFLHAGAGGSAGTMAEPYAIAGKFPHAHIHTHLRLGASLAEAFWASIQLLNEILPVGDPLMQPYAVFPTVTITAPTANSAVRGTVAIRVTATAPTVDLYVDGRRIALGAATEPVQATRTAGGFTLDTTSLSDGWHEVRVVAANADAVRTQGEALLPLTVENQRRAVRLTGPAHLTYRGAGNSVTYTLTGLDAPRQVAVCANGRVLGTVAATAALPLPATGQLVIPGAALPPTGRCTLYAIATLANDERISSPPLTLPVEWPALPAVAAPALAPGVARLRYFAATDKALTWNEPTVEMLLPEDQCPGGRLQLSAKSLRLPDVAEWEQVDYTKKPALECTAWCWLPEGDIYDFQLPGGGELAIDGTVLPGEKNGLLGPLSLAPGWHELRLRVTLAKAGFTHAVWLRGGTVAKLNLLPIAWCAAPAPAEADAEAPPAPRVRLAAESRTSTTQLTLTAEGDAALTYSWRMLTAPRLGAVNHPDEPAPVLFTPNGSAAARTTTATFRMAGAYLLRVCAENGRRCAYADIRVTVQPVLTGLSLTAASQKTSVGYPVDLYASVQDQFGRRLPDAPPVVWAAPTGVFTALSGETARFRPSAPAAPCPITATAAGKTGAVSLTIASNEPPKIQNLTASPAGKDQVVFYASITDPDAPPNSRTQPTCVWSQEPTGAPTLNLATPGALTTKATLPSAGTYRMTVTATDAAGATATETLALTVAAKADGTLVFAPRPRLTDHMPVLTQPVTLWVTGVYGAATYAWESSGDNGATWHALPETTNRIVYGPVTEGDQGRLFRVTVTNEAGTATSNAGKLTVRDPEGGLLSFAAEGVVAKLGADAVTLSVQRQRQRKGKVELGYSLTPTFAYPQEKRAQPKIDYPEVTGTVSWDDGDAADKPIIIPLLPRATAPGRGFSVRLFNKAGTQTSNSAGIVVRGECRVWLPSAEEPEGPVTAPAGAPR
jgi:uncharacterized protein (TIGR03790 family)